MNKVLVVIMSFVMIFVLSKSASMAEGENMVKNGSFETPEVTDSSKKWQTFDDGKPGLEWKVEWMDGSGGSTTPAKLELHKGVNGWLPREGSQYAELDTDWASANNEKASVKISQDINTCSGGKYELTFYWSPRPNNADNKMEVMIGDVVKNYEGSGIGTNQTIWKDETVSFTASSNLTDLSFAETGTPNSLGMFLDDVKVVQVGSCDLNVVKTPSSDTVFAGAEVTYTYEVSLNEGSNDLKEVAVEDDKCDLTEVEPNGDSNYDGLLNYVETWEYECTKTLDEVGTETNVVTVKGVDEAGNTYEGSAEASVEVLLGCVSSQGYWKTHSLNDGEKKYDETWAVVSGPHDQENWEKILESAPKGGNAWTILAHQYIAAFLNDQNAYMPVSVSEVYEDANELIHNEGYDLEDAPSKADRKAYLDAASVLEKYNTGQEDVPYCDSDM